MREAVFERAYPLIFRSAQVRSAAAVVNGAVLLDDRQDLEQELLTCVWQALSKYDPARAGLRTFIELVVRTQFTSMLRLRRRLPEFESLGEQNVAGEDGFREMELRADVRRALADVSLFDRAVALSLTECSAVETSRHMGVSRAAVYRAIGRLRLALSVIGLAGRPRRCVACRRKSDRRSRTGHQEARP